MAMFMTSTMVNLELQHQKASSHNGFISPMDQTTYIHTSHTNIEHVKMVELTIWIETIRTNSIPIDNKKLIQSNYFSLDCNLIMPLLLKHCRLSQTCQLHFTGTLN